MLNPKIEKALNEQLNKEFFSSYLYLSMSAYYSTLSLDGFANWMRVQYDEEFFHAMKFYAYIIERGGKVVLETITKPQTDWEGVIDVFEATLEHERFVTSSINNLASLAVEEKDHATINFLNWFVNEQVEEEATAENILNKLKLIGEDGNGVYMMDKELATRVFVPPVTPAAKKQP